MKGNCIIYGGGGFIGSHLAEELLANGYSVTIFDKLNFSRANLSALKDKINIIEGDFNNETDLLSSLKGMDYVYHLVSSTLPASSNENPVYDVESNLISTLKLLQDIKNNDVRKIIFISSGGTVYGYPDYTPIKENHPRRPVCSYGIIKKTIEDYLFMYKYLYGLDYIVFRLSNPYGERQNPLYSQGVIPVFIKKFIKNETIAIWGDGEVKRDFIYIKDAVKPMVDSLVYGGAENIFNLGSGKATSLNELIGTLEKVFGKKFPVEYIESRKVDVPVNVLDISRTAKELGYNPHTSLENGIQSTYNYLKDYFKV
ncbi:MAG: NAD-dependent epimerase/dehydratase family protein [Ignavibacteria bacterium]|nr:NAD-dependent epimerase/dehydratase family protein [Ignavibacteria bacterium]